MAITHQADTIDCAVKGAIDTIKPLSKTTRTDHTFLLAHF